MNKSRINKIEKLKEGIKKDYQKIYDELHSMGMLHDDITQIEFDEIASELEWFTSELSQIDEENVCEVDQFGEYGHK